MITTEERAFIETRAFVPEHLPGYVTAITGADPYLIDDFLFYLKGATLIFIGYPLTGKIETARIQGALNTARTLFKPEIISISAPMKLEGLESDSERDVSEDIYYILDLDSIQISKKLQSQINRASRDLIVLEDGRFCKEHLRLIQDFVRSHQLLQGMKTIFRRIGQYLEIGSARLIEARNHDGRLVAFDLVDFSAKDAAFYMFNFISRKWYVPGGSDLLMSHLVESARQENKQYINLGLGTNPGVTFFKNKWGAKFFLTQRSWVLSVREESSYASIVDMLLD